MSDPAPDNRQNPAQRPDWPELVDFSLVLGGPLYQLLRRARLEDRVEDYVLRRILVICGVIWLPLALICLLEGSLLSGPAVPFVADIETHARFLVAVPLLILAELIVHQRMRGIVLQFIERGLVTGEALVRFRAALQAAMRLRNSVTAEVLLLVLLFPIGMYVRLKYFTLESDTWYAQVESGSTTPTLAGYWFLAISNAAFQFLVFRWYFRFFIWARFLWQVSRIELNLWPMHPDRNAGLGFLGGSAYALSPLLTAHGVAVAGMVANRIFHQGASLVQFKLEIVVLVAALLLLVIGPFFVFAPRILAARRQGLRDYGILAADYTRLFHQRWVDKPECGGEPLLGSGDIQSLADLSNAFAIVKETHALPVGRDTFLQLIFAALLPFAPLLLTMFPLEELLNRLIGAVF
jgi:hypothetical protein